MQIRVGDKVKFNSPVQGQGEATISRIDVHQLGRPGWYPVQAFDLAKILGYRVGVDLSRIDRHGCRRIVPAIFGPDANDCTFEVLR